jgi:GAF domain-containing protein
VLVQALAGAAGVAIDNAHLYEEATVRQRWLEATGEITSKLLAGLPVEDASSPSSPPPTGRSSQPKKG